MLRALRITAVLGLLTGAGVFGVAGSASALTTLVTCPTGSVTGSGTVTPPVSSTNTMDNVIASSASFSGCTGKETSGMVSSTTTTLAPGTCAGLANPPPKGTTTATGTFTITWGDASVSTGTIKTKSGGSAGAPSIVIEKITSGKFFKAGHITKSKTSLTLTPGAGQDCTTVPISSFTLVNATPAKTTET